MKKVFIPIAALILATACGESRIADDNLQFDVDSVGSQNQSSISINPETRTIDITQPAQPQASNEQVSPTSSNIPGVSQNQPVSGTEGANTGGSENSANTQNSTAQNNTATTPDAKKKMSNTTKGALIGAGAGAATGAVAGAIISKNDPAKGAVIGGLIGGAVGSGVGYGAGAAKDKSSKTSTTTTQK